MIQKIMRFRDNIVLFSLTCYGLGFAYMSIYYSSFNVPIVFYVSLNDILLFALTFIVPALGIILILEEALIPALKTTMNTVSRIFRMPKISDSGLNGIIFLSTMILILLWAVFIYKLVSDPKNNFLFLMCAFYLLNRKFKFDDKKMLATTIATFCCLFFMGIVSVIYHIHLGKSYSEVKFRSNDHLIYTGFHNNLRYIGETSSFLFLYNFKSKTTSVFEKDKISDLKYSDRVEKTDLKALDFDPYSESSYLFKNVDNNKRGCYQWGQLKNHKDFLWFAEQSPKGVMKILGKLNSLLNDNGLDKEIPYFNNSYLPKDLELEDDFKILNDSLMSGNYEVEKTWLHSNAWISLIMNKKSYYIRIIIKDNSKYYVSKVAI